RIALMVCRRFSAWSKTMLGGGVENPPGGFGAGGRPGGFLIFFAAGGVWGGEGGGGGVNVALGGGAGAGRGRVARWWGWPVAGPPRRPWPRPSTPTRRCG